ncbi:MAG: nitronate monooxygenase [Candidatus Cloacimonetes bacterium]|nr:nitronate monooxygenase [Candidatus Cloacimonadota bacterium]
MKSLIMPSLQIGGIETPTPIVQGGMGVGISLAGLASAVANQGGIGVISSVGLGLLHPDASVSFEEANNNGLRTEIRRARAMTDGVLGVNIMVALADFDEQLKTAFEEEIDVVFLGAGLPVKMPTQISLTQLRSSNTKVAVIVSSARAAKLIFSVWSKKYKHVPDAVVVEGPKAGGHLGFAMEQIGNPDYALENILPPVLDVVAGYEAEFGKTIPVIAAGGIYTGADVHRFLKIGAAGVQMGTRFVGTEECDAADAFKQQYIDCTEDDLIIIKSPVGLPGRAINNDFLRDVKRGLRKPFECTWKCLKTCKLAESQYCVAQALANAREGFFEGGFAFAGANAHLVKKIVSVREVFESLAEEFRNAVLNEPELLLV